ncbi:MAG: phosphoribosylamine--glycine ligase [Gammaproteobacteria bacterium]|nr:phosphoribosylamine--glycine ligase [Gammaproteobacteria bacterium]
MKILIVGSGARELAIARALLRSPQHPQLYCYISSRHPELIALSSAFCLGDLCDIDAVLEAAKNWQVDLAIIGPEAPLEKGLADLLWTHDIPTIGPRQSLARIETSKAFARYLMQKYDIPGLPRFRVFDALTNVLLYLKDFPENGYVIKADGLAGGKGVKVAGLHFEGVDEGYQFCESIIEQEQSFLIEEKCLGEEFSLLGFCDGNSIYFMPPVQDYKRAWVGDEGPNTGGMGSISDADHLLPFLSENDLQAAQAICRSVLESLQIECGEKYHGILYGGFMVTANGVRVIEFNARFGDPEAMNVLALLQTDFVAICQAMVKGELSEGMIAFAHQATVCKYAVPEGYPDSPVSGQEMYVRQANHDRVYLAGVEALFDKLYLTGSRTVAVLGVADTLSEAEHIAEAEINCIQGPLFHREDIGTAEMIQARVEKMLYLRRLFQ